MGTQLGWHVDQEDCPAMSLGERIRQLRKEAGWSQTELAERISVDPGRVSKYEAGRMSPSPEALIRLAETLNVSLDYLLIEDVPRRPLHAAQDALGNELADLAELDAEDLALVRQFVAALVTKTRLKTLAGTIA